MVNWSLSLLAIPMVCCSNPVWFYSFSLQFNLNSRKINYKSFHDHNYKVGKINKLFNCLICLINLKNNHLIFSSFMGCSKVNWSLSLLAVPMVCGSNPAWFKSLSLQFNFNSRELNYKYFQNHYYKVGKINKLSNCLICLNNLIPLE